MPGKPRSPKAAPVTQLVTAPNPPTDEVQGWDEYVEEAKPDVPPFRKRMPDGTILEVGCPTSEQIDDLGKAQMRGDVHAMFLAVFGPDWVQTLLDLTAQQPFTVRVKLINDVMFHYGMNLAQLPNSAPSST